MYLFGLVSLLGAICPGPACFIVLKNCLSHSKRIAIFTVIGVLLALSVHLLYTVWGVGLLTKDSFFYDTIKLLGALYLFFLGFKALYRSYKKKQEFSPVAGAFPTSSPIAFKEGFLTNLLNPQDPFFFIALFSQFITHETPMPIRFEYLFFNLSISATWYFLLIYLVTLKAFMAKINHFKVIVERTMGCAFILFSLKLLFD